MNKAEQGTANNLRGAYGEWLVHAIASSAGLSPQKPLPDQDGVDVVVRHKRKSGFPRSPSIELQVKTTSDPTRMGDSFHVSLKRDHYEHLRGVVGKELVVARFLVLVHAPKSRPDLCLVDPEQVIMKNTVYWTSLMGMPSLAPDLQSTTVTVPVENLLTPRALFALVVSNDDEVDEWMSA